MQSSRAASARSTRGSRLKRRALRSPSRPKTCVKAPVRSSNAGNRRSRAPDSASAVAAGVLFFARGHAHVQAVFRWRQWAGRVGREGTRRVSRLVEIEHELAVLRQRRIEETGGAVGFLATRAIGE